MAQMARHWIGVQDRLQTNIDKLAKAMTERAAAGKPVTQAALWQMDRYQALILQVQHEIARYVDEYAVGAVSMEQIDMVRLAAQHFADEAQAQIGITFSRLPVEAVLRMAGKASDGSPLRQVLLKSWPTAVDHLTTQLVNGVALGWNPRKTAKAMRDGVDTGLDRMIGIARTETIGAYRLAQYDAALSTGRVRGFRRLAARQARTCLACLADDGHFYPADDMPGDHFQGRCRWIACWQGRDDDTWTLGREWLAEQDESVQRDVMGARRWELWKSGELSFDDMVERSHDRTWGPSIGVKPLGNSA